MNNTEMLNEVIDLKEKLKKTDEEIKNAAKLIRILPRRRQKLLKLRDETADRCNKLIKQYKLPLKEVI